MTTIMVATFVKDRYEHLLICQNYLRRSADVKDFEFHLVAFDDNSTEPRVRKLLTKLFARDVIVTRPCPDGVRPDSCQPAVTPGQRIGCARHLAVNMFLHLSKCEYLMLLDCDIIVSKEVIARAVKDYQMMSASHNVGGMSLYIHPNHIYRELNVKGTTYGFGDLTGDAHMLFRRDALENVGNHFGSAPGGFADTQIRAMLAVKHVYFTRMIPTYEVQHIGFGEGASSIYPVEAGYFWTKRPYWTYKEPKKVIQVKGFDVLQYADCVMRLGGIRGARSFADRAEKTVSRLLWKGVPKYENEGRTYQEKD